MPLDIFQQFQDPLFAGILAVFPAIFWFWFYFAYSAKSESGSSRLGLKLFLLGLIAAGATYAVERFFSRIFTLGGGYAAQFVDPGAFAPALAAALASSFLFVAPVEEFAKFLAIKLFAFRSLKFDSVIDMVRGGVAVGLGFATMENVLYFAGVLNTSGTSAILELFFFRFFISTFAHTIYSAVMGYWLGLARIHAIYRQQFIRCGLISAILLHGAFNFFFILNFGLASVAIIVAASFVILRWFSMRLNFLPLAEARKVVVPLFASRHETEALLYLGGLKQEHLRGLSFCPFCLAPKNKAQQKCARCKAPFA